MVWKGAGGWVIFSQLRQVNFSRTVCTIFHCRGTTSNVSVMSSPSLASLPPQHGQAVGAGITTRSRGRCSGKGARTGFLRVKLVTIVPASADLALAANSFAGARLQLLELQLELIEELGAALGRWSEALAPQF